MSSQETPAALSGARKAAILLSILGEDASASILRNLPEDDLQRITHELSNLGAIPAEIMLQVLEEYQQMMTAQDFLAIGGREVALRYLVKAFGEMGAKTMAQRLLRDDEDAPGRMDILRRADPHQLARFLVGEHSQTKALILGHLDSKMASTLLMKLEPEARADCVRRIANMGQFSPEIAGKVTEALNRRFSASVTFPAISGENCPMFAMRRTQSARASGSSFISKVEAIFASRCPRIRALVCECSPTRKRAS